MYKNRQAQIAYIALCSYKKIRPRGHAAAYTAYGQQNCVLGSAQVGMENAEQQIWGFGHVVPVQDNIRVNTKGRRPKGVNNVRKE